MSEGATRGDDEQLGMQRRGAGARRVVLVHGFTQSAASWDTIAVAPASPIEVVAVDAPGHGRSAHVRLSLDDGARLLAALGPATYVGYSMGGRYCLALALQEPKAVDALVLVSTTAGIEDPDERRQRRQGDEVLGQRVMDIGVEAFVDWWLSTPLFASLPPEAAARESRLANRADGLASSLRLAGVATVPAAWDRLHELTMPVLVVTGELDARYCALGARLAAGIGPNARHQCLPGVGHACHLEDPETFAAVLNSFLLATAATR